jgi:predicted alpha/beta-fold hydrolase
MPHPLYSPPLSLKNGLLMTLHIAFQAPRYWDKTIAESEPNYQAQIFVGTQKVPIYGIVAIPDRPKSTIIGTYGITGELDNQWFLKILAHKAFAQGHAIVLFDWRGHVKTAELSPTLTSDGLFEGEDFVRIAAQAKQIGCPPPFCFTGYSLGGQLALWGLKSAQTINNGGGNLDLQPSELGGCAVICPSLDSERSLTYLRKHPVYKYIEKSITRNLKKLAWHLHEYHPDAIDAEAIKRVNSIWSFDRELVIAPLGLSSVEEYYRLTSPLAILPHLQKPTFILYAADDPLFAPQIVADLKRAVAANPLIDLWLTSHGGHVGYISSKTCQAQWGDGDRWYAWNRVLQWWDLQIAKRS